MGTDFSSYISTYRRRAERLAKEGASARSDAMRDALAFRGLLEERFHVDRVYLFGSIIQPDKFRPDSDIDVAVEGLAEGDYFPALAALNNRTPFWVDLVTLENAPKSLEERVRREGVLIYELQTVNGPGSTDAPG